jgi:NAD(P)-dependent dehydrogenase (short-subunit alcohol dehydrogenase family)
MTDAPLQGRVAAVTGAGRGIGANIARALARAGASVVVNDIGADIDGTGRSDDIANGVVDTIAAAGGQAVVHNRSIATFAGADSLVSRALDAYGRLDVVVNCAGNSIMGLPWEMSEEQWDSVIDTHLKGHFGVMRAASVPMREQRSGTMITVTSRAGLFGVAESPAYCSAKAGITGLTKSFALAMAPYNVNVNAIAPSATTRMSVPPDDIERLRIRALGMGITEAEEHSADELRHMMEDTSTIENWVAYLASPAGTEITGSLFTVSNRHIGLLGPWGEIATLDAEGEPWTLEALTTAVPGAAIAQPTITTAPR